MDLGQAPEPTALAALLRERWIKDPRIDITVEDDYRDERPRLIVRIDRPGSARRPRERIQVDITHLRGAAPGHAWPELVDATDAPVGQLAESDYAYRDLPVGSDVVFGDGVYWVEVVTTRPDLEAEAEKWLKNGLN